MAQSIPVSKIVEVIPGVVGTGGNPLALNAVMLTKSLIAPVTSLLTFTSLADVQDYFGISATESTLAARYFAGFDNSTQKPGTLFIGGYAAAADTKAWFRGSRIGLTLTELQAVTGTLSVTIDGVVKSAASINLSAATSFAAASALLNTALGLTGGAAVVWDAAASRFQINSGTTGTSSTITTPTGTAAPALGLNAGTLSQGVIADTPATAADRAAGLSGNWASLFTVFEPDLADKTAFADWANSTNDRYVYVAWDSDTGYKTPNNSATFGAILAAGQYDGSVVVYNTADLAAFVAGYIASIDWNATNGRATAAFRSQSGLTPTVTDNATATAVTSNNASYYGTFSAPGDGNNYNILYDGRIAGRWKWLDSYVNQIFLNAQLQLALFTGLQSVNSVPYNDPGYTLVRSWATDPINQALNNGTIRTGVTLSAQQKAAINTAAGRDISSELQSQGYYLQIRDASAQTRGNRTSPPITLWYTDGGSIQQITMASIAVL